MESRSKTAGVTESTAANPSPYDTTQTNETKSRVFVEEDVLQKEGHPSGDHNEIPYQGSVWRRMYRGFINFLGRVFTFPLREEPISFYRPSDFNSKGEYIAEVREDAEKEADELEALVNFDEKSKVLFEKVLQRRKMDLLNLAKLNTEPVDLTKFPLWNEETINYLRTTFKTFDSTQDGLLSLENWDDMLFEFGDQSSSQERETQFYRASNGERFIDFHQFLDLLYTVTMEDHKSPQTALLAVGIRTVNFNISRMKNLDLVQRMQVGMF